MDNTNFLVKVAKKMHKSNSMRINTSIHLTVKTNENDLYTKSTTPVEGIFCKKPLSMQINTSINDDPFSVYLDENDLHFVTQNNTSLITGEEKKRIIVDMKHNLIDEYFSTLYLFDDEMDIQLIDEKYHVSFIGDSNSEFFNDVESHLKIKDPTLTLEELSYEISTNENLNLEKVKLRLNSFKKDEEGGKISFITDVVAQYSEFNQHNKIITPSHIKEKA